MPFKARSYATPVHFTLHHGSVFIGIDAVATAPNSIFVAADYENPNAVNFYACEGEGCPDVWIHNAPYAAYAIRAVGFTIKRPHY